MTPGEKEGKKDKVTCAPSERTDQPAHPYSLIRVFAVRSICVPNVSSCGQTAMTLIRLSRGMSGCPDSESSLRKCHIVGLVVRRLKLHYIICSPKGSFTPCVLVADKNACSHLSLR